MMQLTFAPESSEMKDSTSDRNISRKVELFIPPLINLNKSQLEVQKISFS
jgi:hypothetical protein